jgi:hypothetical protein
MEHIKPQNVGQYTPDHLHEESDVNVKGILAFAAFLVVMFIVIFGGMALVQQGLNRWADKMEPPPNPMVAEQLKAGGGRVGDVAATHGSEDVQKKLQQIVGTFPEPRLQPDEVRDMDKFRQSEDRILHSYSRVDANGNTVRIPIERAMEIVAERGLPNFGGPAPTPATQPKGQALGQPGQSSGKLPAAADKTTKK